MCVRGTFFLVTIPLYLFVFSGVEWTDKDGFTALSMAVAAGHLDLAKFLLDKGASASVKFKDGSTAAHHAATAGNFKLVELLHANGADLNAEYELGTVLHCAASQGAMEAVDKCIELGANLDVVNSMVWSCHCSLYAHSYLPYSYLLYRCPSARTHIFCFSQGLTPLLFATASGKANCACSLVNAGANLKLCMPGGISALHVSAETGQKGNLEMIQKLYASTHVHTSRFLNY